MIDMTKCTVTSSRPFEQKEKFRCMFCRGGSCNRCGETAYLSLTNPAIDKLHSTWIDESILAMQRPNDALMKDSNLIEQFQSNGIVAIFNLTEPGEHPYCGGGNLKESGFPYHPEKLMAAGIKHFNYAWPDMTAPSISLMKDIVRVACNEITQGGKIAVHCHAGYGRTGIAIAAILISLRGMTGLEVINLIRQKRPGSIQTMKQKQFVYEFERCHWDAMRVYPNYDHDAAERAEEQDQVDSFSNSIGFSNTSSFSKSVVFSRSMLDFSMSPAKSPRSHRKQPSERSERILEIETSSKTMQSKSRMQSSHNLSNNVSVKTRSTSKDKELKELNTPRSIVSDGGSGHGFKSIAQSLRDQQYSIPVDELHFVNSGNSPGPSYQGTSETGTADLMWNHKSVILCANALKESCSVTKGTNEGPSAFDLDETVTSSEGNVRAVQSAVNLASVCTAMTGLFVTSTGALDNLQSHTQRTILELLDSSAKDGQDTDEASEDDFLIKKNEISNLRLEVFKSEMNRGIWTRLHATSKNLFSILSQADNDSELTLIDQVKKINEEYKSMECVKEFQLDCITPLHTEYDEVLGLKDSISVFSQLLLDFIDSRSDSILDDHLTKKLFLSWGGEESTDPSDTEVTLPTDKSTQKVEGDETEDDENNMTDSSTTANSLKSEMEKKSDIEYADKMFQTINSLFESDKLERPKLSLLQQIVDILKKFYSVITPPQDPGPAPTLPIHGTSDLDTSVLNDSECRADNDETAQQDCYKLICLRFAVSCSQSLRNQKFIFPMEGEGNRPSREMSLPLSKAILKSFTLDNNLRPFTPRCMSSAEGRTSDHAGDDVTSPSPDPDPIDSATESLCISACEDVQIILGIMKTLHLLAIKSWCHLGILPNRLRLNRRLS